MGTTAIRAEMDSGVGQGVDVLSQARTADGSGTAILTSGNYGPDHGGSQTTDPDIGADDTRQLIASAQFAAGNGHG